MVVQLFYSGTKVNKSTQKILPAGNTLHEKEILPIMDNNCYWCIYVESIDDVVLEVRRLFVRQ